MPEYRRNFVPGGTYLFTCVTYRRQPILTTPLGRLCLREAIQDVQADHPFEVVAIVLLPDHWHTVWTLPRGDARFPVRWSRIKEQFSRSWLAHGGVELAQSTSRQRQRYRGIWQKRYWEHTVLDENDLQRCVDYIHWNPRKRNLALRVRDWQWSSFHRFVALGEYDLDWGGTDPTPGWNTPEWDNHPL